MAKRTPPRLLNVVDIQQVTPLLRRIILSGDALQGFPANSAGAHLKVFLPRTGQDELHMPILGPDGPVWPPADKRPVTRTYSVRYYDPEQNLLAIDFVMHGHPSYACAWASAANVGDQLGIAGPGGPEPLLAPADFHILAGDLSALPALSAILENLPAQSRGDVFIEVAGEEHIHDLRHPEGFRLHWIFTGKRYRPDLLSQHIARLKVDETLTLSAWVAGESDAVVDIRDQLRQRYGLTKKSLYAVPYWRYGNTEEQYHQTRHDIMDEEY